LLRGYTWGTVQSWLERKDWTGPLLKHNLLRGYAWD
jgi:hypothetical protein